MSISTARDAGALDQRWGELERDRDLLTARLAEASRALPGAEADRERARMAYERERDRGGGWGADQPPASFLTARDRYEDAMGRATDAAVAAAQARQGLGRVADELAVVQRAAEAEVSRAAALLGALENLKRRLKAARPAGQQSPRG